MSELTSRGEMFAEAYLDSLKGRMVSVRKNCKIGRIIKVSVQANTVMDDPFKEPEDRVYCDVVYDDGVIEHSIELSKLDMIYNKENTDDPVNHPSHYANGKYEVIDFIEDRGLNKSFHLGNAVKYIVRAGKKDPSKEKEDIEKAIWYLKRYLNRECNYGDGFTIECGIPTSEFVKDKGLEGTPRGIALELITECQFNLAIKVLQMCIKE